MPGARKLRFDFSKTTGKCSGPSGDSVSYIWRNMAREGFGGEPLHHLDVERRAPVQVRVLPDQDQPAHEIGPLERDLDRDHRAVTEADQVG